MYPRPVKEGKQLIEGRSLGAERLLHDSHTTMRNCAWEHRHRHDLSTSLYSTDSLALFRGRRTVCMHARISKKRCIKVLRRGNMAPRLTVHYPLFITKCKCVCLLSSILSIPTSSPIHTLALTTRGRCNKVTRLTSDHTSFS
jgi:hypothetical protein